MSEWGRDNVGVQPGLWAMARPSSSRRLPVPALLGVLFKIVTCVVLISADLLLVIAIHITVLRANVSHMHKRNAWFLSLQGIPL